MNKHDPNFWLLWISTGAAVAASVAAVVSSVASILSGHFAKKVYQETRELMIPNERPIIAIRESKTKIGDISENKKALKIHLTLGFQNIGQHPAENMKLAIWAAPISDPKQLRKLSESSVANPIYPKDKFARVLSGTLIIEGDWNLDAIEKPTLFIYVNATYYDALNPKRSHSTPLYIVYKLGAPKAGHASLEQRAIFEPYLQKHC